MDADKFVNCKENIQPLRHGRNAAQLVTALQADEDEEAEHILLQEKRHHEEMIRTYEGDDPLEKWYEFIIWLEQSDPKGSHDHTMTTLRTCLSTFEHDPRYQQDRRFIRLWIKFLNLQKDPIELYQMLYHKGIGTMVADFYRAWAFELEQADDYKRADEIYVYGIAAHAEPFEELEAAHRNFQLAVGRKFLGRVDDMQPLSPAEQRQAFSCLKSIGSGKQVGVIRTGDRIRDCLPGTVPQMLMPQKSNAIISIYQDEDNKYKGSILNYIAEKKDLYKDIHKENSLKAGPWTGAPRIGGISMSSAKPSFKIHEDGPEDNFSRGIQLGPNHIWTAGMKQGMNHDEAQIWATLDIPTFVLGSQLNPNVNYQSQYPKKEVYSNNEDRSLEELLAQRYFSKQKEQTNSSVFNNTRSDVSLQMNQDNEVTEVILQKIKQVDRELIELQRQYYERKRDKERQKQIDLERQKQIEMERQKHIAMEMEQKQMERQQQMEMEHQKQMEIERQKQLEMERVHREEMERQQKEAEQLEKQRLEVQRIDEMSRMNVHQQQQQHNNLYMQHQDQNKSLHDTSLTINTKQARSIIESLWQSPVAEDHTQRIPVTPVMHKMPNDGNNMKFPFDIHMDSSMTQHAMSAQKDHATYNTTVYNDQENHPQYLNSYDDRENQSSFNQSVVQNSYHYHVQQHHSSHMQPQQTLHDHQHHTPHMQPQPLYDHQASLSHSQHPQHSPHPQHPQHQHQYQHHMPHLESQIHHSTPQHLHHSPHIQHHQQHQQHQQHQYHSPHIQSASLHLQSPNPLLQTSSQNLQTPSQHLQNPSQHLQNHSQLLQSPSQHLQNPSQHLQAPSPQIQTSQHQQLPHMQSHYPMHMQEQPVQQHLTHSMHMQPQHMHMNSQHHMTAQHIGTPQHVNNQQHIAAQQQLMEPSQQHSYNVDHMRNSLRFDQYDMQQQHQSQHSSIHHSTIDSRKQLDFSVYADPDTSKSFRMPAEQPYDKTPVPNRRYLKDLLKRTENKENSIGIEYKRSMIAENLIKQQRETNNMNANECFETSLPDESENYTEMFKNQLKNFSTPLTNYYKSQCYAPKDDNQYHSQTQSVLEEFGYKKTLSNITETTETNYSNEENMRAIQAMQAQSPRTMQRNVDQITSDIKNTCDLRKPLTFKYDQEAVVNAETMDSRLDTMDYEPMEADPVMQEGVIEKNEFKDEEVKSDEVKQLKKQVEEEEVEEEKIEIDWSGEINPFDRILISKFLQKMKFPKQHHSNGYYKVDSLAKLVPSTTIKLGNEEYDLEKCLGKGAYGTVFKAVNLRTRKVVALKMQKPAWVWEYYIAREIKARLTNPYMLRGFMDVEMAYVADNGSILVSEYSKYGTLLNVSNQVKQATGKFLPECLSVFFTIEMLQIVEYLHKCQIIHGDIKPDNFLLMHTPIEDVRPTIQLIDFGCSIDMTLFPDNTSFTNVIKTEDFTCIEMQCGKPWTYQTDLYCLAASSHCLLFGNYMKVSNVGSRWFINSKIPRYAKREAWELFFTELLNVESCTKLPDLSKLRNVMEEALSHLDNVQSKFRHFSNLLNKR